MKGSQQRVRAPSWIPCVRSRLGTVQVVMRDLGAIAARKSIGGMTVEVKRAVVLGVDKVIVGDDGACASEVQGNLPVKFRRTDHIEQQPLSSEH